MKKYILGLVIALGIFVSYSTIQAATFTTQSQINAVVEVLRAFNVDENKIIRIVNILNEGNDGCIAGNKFSTTTGKPCQTNAAGVNEKKVEPVRGKCTWPCIPNAEA